MNTRHHYLSLLRTFALATLTAAAVTACTDDNGDPAGSEPITPADGIPVTFTANINPGSDADPDGAPGTRTILEPTQDGGFTVTWKGRNDYPNNCDLLYIWAVKGNTPENNGSPKYYVPTTSAASSELVPYEESDKFTLSSEGNWMFAAIYGHRGAGGFGLGAATVSPQEQLAPNDIEHIAAADFSVATDTKTVTANSGMPAIINFKFEHKLSALQLHVTNQTGEALTVREIRLSAAGGQITSSKKYDVVTGGWKNDGEQKSDYLQLEIRTPAELASGGTAQDFHMLLFPEPAHGGTDMTITVITNRGEFTLTKPAPNGGFLAGKNYLTDITITSTPGTGETWTEYVGISTPQELAAFSSQVNNGTDNYAGKTVRLLNNITLTGAWTPIGTEAKPFSGTFDGGGYSISGLNVNISERYAGLFGYVDGGKVCNLRVKGNVTTTQNFVGGIAGRIDNSSTVENCIFDGTANGTGKVGGIAGFSKNNSRIAGCYTKGSILVGSNGGGIVGDNYGTVDNCYSQATVTASTQTSGGIAGVNGRNGTSVGTVTHCYATGAISDMNMFGGSGGIVGLNDVTLENCIALNPGITRTSGDKTAFGRITGSGSGSVNNCGAFVGMKIRDAGGTDFYATATGKHGDDLTAAECLTEATYTGRGFTTTDGWVFDNAATWTYLPWNKAFESFHNINKTDYRISVPQHITNALSN